MKTVPILASGTDYAVEYCTVARISRGMDLVLYTPWFTAAAPEGASCWFMQAIPQLKTANQDTKKFLNVIRVFSGG